jgi:dTDP-4-dehydrorhamnose 3,5-epimerase
MSEHRRRLMAIPPGVWHANVNLGSKDAVIVNFKTEPYNHDDPDKYLRPLDSDEIPYRFKGEARGW